MALSWLNLRFICTNLKGNCQVVYLLVRDAIICKEESKIEELEARERVVLKKLGI